MVPQTNQSMETRMSRKTKAPKIKIKARGHYIEEVKKLSPKAQKKFHDAAALARRKKKRHHANSESRVAVHPSKDKRLAKEIRAAMSMPKPPKHPYAALMQPMVIVPDALDGKPVIADAGSIVELLDQRILYRDRISPITKRADELLVHYGKAKTPSLGWLTNMHGAKAMKPSRGPVFLVNSRDEVGLIAWEKLRLKVARVRKPGVQTWIVPWLMKHGKQYPRELREVTRFFGGKPIKNEELSVRVRRLFTLIYGTEAFDMATKTAKSKKAKASAKVSKKTSKKAKPSKDQVTAKQDEYVIRRLVKENPRRAGSEKAKIWAKLKKGMTVGEFVKKGGTRGAVRKYVENGWAKLLKPKGE
jgi:hypothetical protein